MQFGTVGGICELCFSFFFNVFWLNETSWDHDGTCFSDCGGFVAWPWMVGQTLSASCLGPTLLGLWRSECLQGG